MANTTWKQVVYDVADGIRTLLGTSSTIPVGELKGKLTGITRKGAATYTPSTSAQTIAAGQYLAGAQTIAAMPNGALSDVSVSSSGLITGQVGTSGYLASGTKKTKQLTTQAAKTITPNNSSQTAANSGVYTTGAVTVAAVPTETKTVTPTTSVQTITPSSGKYLSSVTVEASSTDIANGIIEQYCSYSGTISANTFVEFVNNGTLSGIGTDVTVASATSAGYGIEAVKLSENKVLILYSHNPGIYQMYYYLYGVICTISGNTITAGTATSILQSGNAAYNMQAIAISENTVLLAHTSGKSVFTLQGSLLTISGTTITIATTCTFSGTALEDPGLVPFNITKLSDSKYYISHTETDAYNLYGVVFTISGDTISVGTDTMLGTSGLSADSHYAVALSENKVLILHNHTTDYEMRCTICTISGTTITVASAGNKIIDDDGVTRNVTAIALNENSAFVAYGEGGDYSQTLTGAIINVNGTTPTLANSVSLSSDSYTAIGTNLIKISDDVIFIVHAKTNSYYLAYTVVQINGSDITVLSQGTLLETSRSGGTNYYSTQHTPSVAIMSNGALIVAHSLSDAVGAMVLGITETTIQAATNPNKIKGITKTQATATTKGQVWVLA